MATFISEANYGYSELDKQARIGNDLEYAIDELRELVSAAYPDNSRDARIEDINSAVRYARTKMADYLREIEILVANSGHNHNAERAYID